MTKIRTFFPIYTAIFSLMVGNKILAEDPVWITSINWKNDQQLIATQSQGLLYRPGKIQQFPANQLQQPNTIAEIDSSLWALLPWNDSWLASDYKGKIWQVGAGPSQVVDLKTRWIRCLTLASATEVIAGTEDGQLVVFDPATSAIARQTQVGNSALYQITFHSNRKQIAVASAGGMVQLLSWPELELQKSLSTTGAVWTVVYSTNGEQLITGGSDRKVRLWDVASGQQIVAISSMKDWVTSIASYPNSTLAFTGSLNGDLALIDYHTKTLVKSRSIAPSGIWCLALSPDNQRLALGTRKDGIKVIEISEWLDEAKKAAAAADVERPPQP